jgi:hypothetical protein
MRYALSLFTLALILTLAPLASARADAPSEERWKVGAYVEQDLGILLLFGGVGLYGGVAVGNLRAGVGFNRFESPYRALSGAPDGFGLKVSRLFQLDVSYHPFAKRMDGPYVRAVAQLKRQHAENLDNGVQRDLDSVLVGPELGWVFRVYNGVYLAPRAGAFYYVAPPQGTGNHAIDIGGAAYDNDKHKTFDFFGTLSVGYVFQ